MASLSLTASDGILLVFSLHDPQSFEEVISWQMFRIFAENMPNCFSGDLPQKLDQGLQCCQPNCEQCSINNPVLLSQWLTSLHFELFQS